MPATIIRADGHVFHCTVRNYSDRGIGIQMENPDLLKPGGEITLLLKHEQEEFAFQERPLIHLIAM